MAKKMNTVTESDPNWDRELLKQLKRLEKNAVAVGIHADSGSHEESAGATVAEVGFYNEYGTAKIPERSFMRSTLKEKVKQYQAALKKVAKSAINNPSSARVNMGKVGQIVSNDIQNKIVSLRTPPNAKGTIAKKGTTNPLIASGQMVNSIKWKYLKEKVTKADD
jgi:hypothetical protein